VTLPLSDVGAVRGVRRRECASRAAVHLPFREMPPCAHGVIIKLSAVHAVITWNAEYRCHSARAAMHRRRTE